MIMVMMIMMMMMMMMNMMMMIIIIIIIIIMVIIIIIMIAATGSVGYVLFACCRNDSLIGTAQLHTLYLEKDPKNLML